MVMDRDALLKIIGQLTVEKVLLQDALGQLVTEREVLQQQVKGLTPTDAETPHTPYTLNLQQEKADAGGT